MTGFEHRYYDRDGTELHEGDYVRTSGITDELFRIKRFQSPSDAVIENVLPGGRLGTSTLHCGRYLEKGVNNLAAGPDWFDTRFEEPDLSPIPRTLLPCGCYLRRVDCEAVLCEQHLIEANA